MREKERRKRERREDGRRVSHDLLNPIIESRVIWGEVPGGNVRSPEAELVSQPPLPANSVSLSPFLDSV